VPIFKFFWGPKNHFSPPLKTRDHYALIFYNNSCKIILLFFDLLCTRVEKIFRKWTKKMSKNEIDEILLCKFDAALGNLRNFFGANNTTPYMVRGACIHATPVFCGRGQNALFWWVCSFVCPKNGVSYFRKKGFRVFGGCMARWHVPKTGFLIFGKQGWAISGGATPVYGRCGMSPKRENSFLENKVGRFQGVQSIAVRPIITFIVIKLCPCIVVCVVGCFLPSGDSVCGRECNLSAKREYH